MESSDSTKRCKKCNRNDVEFYVVINRCGRQKGQEITRLTCKGCENKAKCHRKKLNPDKAKNDYKKYYTQHRDDIIKRRTETRKSLPDGYIKKLFGTKENLPKNLIDARRMMILLKRKIDELDKND